MKNLILLISFLTLVFQVTEAQQYTKIWNGSGYYFDDPNNWDPAGVPGPNDLVKIPEGTTFCEIRYTIMGDEEVEVKEIHNFGILKLEGMKLKVDKFHNHSDFRHCFGDVGYASIRGISENSTFINDGEITTSVGQLNISGFNGFTNNGDMNFDGFELNCTTFVNNGIMQNQGGNNGTFNSESFTNNGEIVNEEALDGNGGCLKIESTSILNTGVIRAGISNHAKGGDLNLIASTLGNMKGAALLAGNGVTPSKNGKTLMNCKNITNKGYIKGGESLGSEENKGFE